MTRAAWQLAAGAACIALVAGCAAPARRASPRRGPAAEPFHLSEQARSGDAARRASLRLVLEGLDAEAAGRSETGLRMYERALQVDPTSPHVYLALARHHLEQGQPARALSYLDKAESLLRAQGVFTPGVEAHVSGMRGAALRDLGRSAQGAPLLERARALAPAAWADGELGADELR